jgi:adenylate cyclase
MEPINLPFEEIEDLLNRIARLNALIHLHEQQPAPDSLTIEGYQRMRQQFADELSQLMQETVELNVTVAA